MSVSTDSAQQFSVRDTTRIWMDEAVILLLCTEVSTELISRTPAESFSIKSFATDQKTTQNSVFSLYSGLPTTSDSFTWRPCRKLLLTSSSVRWDGLDFSAEAKEAQLVSCEWQHTCLIKK